MTNNDLSSKILHTIREQHLTPESSMRTQLRRFGLWLGILVCVGVASIGIGTTLSIMQGNSWALYHETGTLSKPVFLFLLSYFWILLVAACIIGTYALFIRTQRGYRYRFAVVTGSIGTFGLLLGMVIFFTGTGHQVDEQCHRLIPGYGQVLSQSNQLWIQPEKGRLAGRVEHIKAPQAFTIVDPYGRLWLVKTADGLRGTVAELEEKKTVHMTGSQVDSSTFFARQILMYQMPDSFFLIFRDIE